jgi:hypothetical protein
VQVPLFDEGVRNGLRPKRETESTFCYLNQSGRPAMTAFRGMADDWFERFPADAKADLRARFRSPIEFQHQAAFFELYVHELLKRLEFGLVAHPTITGTNAHPDFLASVDSEDRFYVEATLAGTPSVREQGAAARVAQVYECLNALDSPNFFLEIQVRGAPETPPPTRELRQRLTVWLRELDPDEVGSLFQADRFGDLPRLEWTHGEWSVVFAPIPKSPEHRGRPGIRPIGIIVPEAQWLNTDGDLREAIRNKATKYGDLGLPLIVAVNVLSKHCDNIDIMNGLFGQETFVVTRRADGTFATQNGRREPNGLWFGPRGPRNRLVSGVLVVSSLCAWTMGILTPELFHNPWAVNPLPPNDWNLPQCLVDLTTGRVQHRAGISAETVLQIPAPWPLPDPEV